MGRHILQYSKRITHHKKIKQSINDFIGNILSQSISAKRVWDYFSQNLPPEFIERFSERLPKPSFPISAVKSHDLSLAALKTSFMSHVSDLYALN